MAVCGWCRAKNLTNSKEAGLQPHLIPNQRRKCEGPSTSPYASKITAKDVRGREKKVA